MNIVAELRDLENRIRPISYTLERCRIIGKKTKMGKQSR